jgi:hypothetical protein
VVLGRRPVRNNTKPFKRRANGQRIVSLHQDVEMS